MEHSICMFIEGRAKKHDAQDLARLIQLVGVDKTVLGSDLGLTQAPKPVDGYRMIELDASDLHLSTGAPPSAKFHGALKILDKEPLRPGRVKEIAYRYGAVFLSEAPPTGAGRLCVGQAARGAGAYFMALIFSVISGTA